MHSFVNRRPVERDAECEARFDLVRREPRAAACDPALLLEASGSIAIAAWQELAPSVWRPNPDALFAFCARHELRAVPGLVAFARDRPEEAMPLLLPFRSADVAGPVAAALAEAGAAEWLTAHPEAAVIGLLPLCAGAPGPDRDHADAALQLVARAGHRSLVLAIADRCGAGALAETALSADPRSRLPDVPPSLPAFWDTAALPAPTLRATGRALPPAALDALGELLAVGTLEIPHRGLDDVYAACDRAPLCELARELCARWMIEGEDAGALCDPPGARALRRRRWRPARRVPPARLRRRG